MKSKTISLRVYQAQYDFLREASERKNMTMSTYISFLILQKMKDVDDKRYKG